MANTTLSAEKRAQLEASIVQIDAIFALEGFQPDESIRETHAAVLAGMGSYAESAFELGDRNARRLRADVHGRHDLARQIAHRNGDRAQPELELLIHDRIAGAYDGVEILAQDGRCDLRPAGVRHQLDPAEVAVALGRREMGEQNPSHRCAVGGQPRSYPQVHRHDPACGRRGGLGWHHRR